MAWFDAHTGLPKAAVPARTPKALRAQVLGVVDEGAVCQASDIGGVMSL